MAFFYLAHWVNIVASCSFWQEWQTADAGDSYPSSGCHRFTGTANTLIKDFSGRSLSPISQLVPGRTAPGCHDTQHRSLTPLLPPLPLVIENHKFDVATTIDLASYTIWPYSRQRLSGSHSGWHSTDQSVAGMLIGVESTCIPGLLAYLLPLTHQILLPNNTRCRTLSNSIPLFYVQLLSFYLPEVLRNWPDVIG